MKGLTLAICGVLFVLLNQACATVVLKEQDNITASDADEPVHDNKRHPCARLCVKGAPRMKCHYTFKVEWYQTLSKACYNCPFNLDDCKREHCVPANGYKRPIISINRQMPGPGIEVCLGDEVIVDVENGFLGDTTSIHWHGMHQRDTPYMDGVPMITQCPIQPGTSFRYHFLALNHGSHMWHSHTGLQRGDGSFGSFVVKVPREDDPHKDLFDHELSEHVMVIQDWEDIPTIVKFTSFYHSDGNNMPPFLLINGLGSNRLFYDKRTNESAYMPTARFAVKQGYRYKFRVINVEFLNCPIEVSVDNHTLSVVATDGNYIEPVEAESIVLSAGERFDFILNADKPIGVYWMRFRGIMSCAEMFTAAHSGAVLQYEGAPSDVYPAGDLTYQDAHRKGLQVNKYNVGSEHIGSVSISQLRAVDAPHNRIADEPDLKYYVAYDFYEKNNPMIHDPKLYGFDNLTEGNVRIATPQINHITLKMPSFSLLTQRDQVVPGTFCNETHMQNCKTDFCTCTHVVDVKLGSLVELILVDKGFAFDTSHPFHLHGYSFNVVAMKKLGSFVKLEDVVEMDRNGTIKRNFVNPPFKDTVNVPDGGFTIVRFVANNPGYWFFHCHIDFHAEIGMALIFKVGDHEDMKPTPEGFPTCGDYYVKNDI